MTSLTLKGIPPELHRRLKASAERNRRSLNQEAQALLEMQLQEEPADVEALLDRIRQVRKKYPFRTSNAEIDRLKRLGRM